jgi:transposase-like protein
MVREHRPAYPSQWAAMTSIAANLGCAAEALRRWVHQAERDAGERPGVPSLRSALRGLDARHALPKSGIYRSVGGICQRRLSPES